MLIKYNNKVYLALHNRIFGKDGRSELAIGTEEYLKTIKG
jgi:hypothetical protein